MDSVTKENTIDVSLDLSDHLGGSVLKEEQKLAVKVLLSGKGVTAVLRTGLGKLISYQSFVVAKNLAVSSSILVVVPFRSIIEDQLRSNDFVVMKFSCGTLMFSRMKFKFCGISYFQYALRANTRR